MKPILLVEDNPHDVELTLIALEKAKLHNDVVVVRDGDEALDYLFMRNGFADRVEGNPALIMLDIKLNKMSGLGVLETLRKDGALRSIPVVMLTGSKEPSDLNQAYALGVNAYVVKPVMFKDFVSAVSDIGLFWAILNEPPPGSSRAVRSSPLSKREQ